MPAQVVQARVQPARRCAWFGRSLLVTNQRLECDESDVLTGYYFREARHLRTLLGLQPVAMLHTMFVDPVLPPWMPEVIVRGLRLGEATVALRFWRDDSGASHAEVIERQGSFHLVRQPPPESLGAGVRDRFGALVETVRHH